MQSFAPSQAPVGRPEIEMVIIQPTAFCNINCSYCYLPDRSNKHVIAQSTVTRLFTELFASGWCNPEITVLWHAGEPLAVPVSFYREAFATIERLRPKGVEGGPGAVRVQHSFQTNGMLIDAEWCRLFRDWQVGVGVSIDGPRELHDAHRKTRSGAGTFDKTIAGIRCLKAANWPVHVLSVLSRASLEMPEEMLAFYISEGIDHVCFNVEESEGDYVSDLFQGAELRQRYERFLRTFWHLARADGRVKFVREIDHALPRVFRPEGVRARNIQVEPLGMINVDSHGNVSSFSPELLGYKNADYGDFLLGNINTQSLAEIYATTLGSALLRDIRVGTEACRANCEYFSVCGGGAPVNKLFENGRFDSTTTSFCTLTQMVPTDLILEAYDKLEQNWTGNGLPAIAPPAAQPAPSPRMP
ncbi:cyclophane-forming radical SAM/SPASM peptide maturase GrrM/OscB [Reyranella sp.]|uniref:cyclophane-forming radical SAM/SPASM peptide maturase GrrM/OscB n=1 Tax=Reyranella sp. TaxID=1929291 RepID=UPI0025D24DC8|nr:cyclophane-forming radical SAM/SPASM peptide maturase GrrM/OscB [Reyranella sp.]